MDADILQVYRRLAERHQEQTHQDYIYRTVYPYQRDLCTAEMTTFLKETN